MTTNHIYFDLFGYINKVPEARIAAHMAASTAWKIDQLLVKYSRDLFKSVRQELFTQGVDGMAELTTALHEAEFAEQAFHEQGSSNEGACENIRWLNSQRDQWHELAAELTALTWDWQGNTRVYDIPSLDDAFHNDRPYKVAIDTQRRMKMSIARRAKEYEWDNETQQRRFESKLARKQDKLQDVKAAVDAMAGAAQLMMHLVLRSDEDSAASRSKEFSALPLEIQRQLLENAQRAAAQVAEWAEDDRSLSDRECDDIDDCAFNVERDLKRVLTSPRFRITAQVNASTETNVG